MVNELRIKVLHQYGLYYISSQNGLMGEMDDAALLAQFRAEHSKEAGFSGIVRKYQEKLYWHIRRMVIDHDDADDVLQNVFIKVWKGLDGFREDARLFTWLYRIATNESLGFLEQRKKKQAIPLSEAGELTASLKADKQFDAGKLEWKLQMAISQLPEKQRLVFNMRYFDEMPYQQISEILNTSEGALKASYHHAAKKIEDFILNH